MAEALPKMAEIQFLSRDGCVAPDKHPARKIRTKEAALIMTRAVRVRVSARHRQRHSALMAMCPALPAMLDPRMQNRAESDRAGQEQAQH